MRHFLVKRSLHCIVHLNVSFAVTITVTLTITNIIPSISIITPTDLAFIHLTDSSAAGLDLLGCYADAGARALDGWYITSAMMTPKLCRNMCKSKVSKLSVSQMMVNHIML